MPGSKMAFGRMSTFSHMQGSKMERGSSSNYVNEEMQAVFDKKIHQI